MAIEERMFKITPIIANVFFVFVNLRKRKKMRKRIWQKRDTKLSDQVVAITT